MDREDYMAVEMGKVCAKGNIVEASTPIGDIEQRLNTLRDISHSLNENMIELSRRLGSVMREPLPSDPDNCKLEEASTPLGRYIQSISFTVYNINNMVLDVANRLEI